MTIRLVLSDLVGEMFSLSIVSVCFFFQGGDGIRNLVRSRGVGDVYKRKFSQEMF